ncbi:unnamed protein product [Caenorhabditis sp. 36 PRJEB53466]|nr:unnamed protein product [Caenorhabditis sp. 36 PRJEB53466]
MRSFIFDPEKDLFDSDLIEEHIGSQPLLAASLFSLIACSFGLVVFAVIFLTCRLRGQCGSQKYQEYPSNSTNYAIYLMLFFISWIIVTSASAYFVLAGAGFWSEKLDARKPALKFSNSSIRLSRSAISELFVNYDYHGDFENVSDTSNTFMSKLKRIHIRRQPAQTFRKRIEIPLRPLAEVQFTGSSGKFIVKNKEAVSQMNPEEETDEAEVDTVINFPKPVQQEQHPEDDNFNESTEGPEHEVSNELEEKNRGNVLVVTGETMLVEADYEPEDASQSKEYKESAENELIPVTITTRIPENATTTTLAPTTIAQTTTTTTVTSTTVTTKKQKPVKTTTESSRATVTTTQVLPETTWEQIEDVKTDDVLDQLLSSSSETTDGALTYNPNMTYLSLHSRILVFICRLTFCFVALALALVILPTFFLIVAGTGCYIYSDHPMNRSSVSNKIGRVVSVNASILLFMSPCLLIFSSFTLFYTHSHELLCATIQLQHQQANGMVPPNHHKSLIETYSINTNQCSRSLAPVQSLLLSSLLLCVSLLPCVFAMFKLVKYYFRMSSEFYWNAADNYAGRQFSKQQEFPRYQSTVIYPDDDLTPGYAYLKENYDSFERPVENSSAPLDVSVRFLLNQILDVDEKNQVMSILAYMDYHWNDYKLKWDPSMFGGIRDVRFSGDDDAHFKLWRPDVLLFNSVSESFDSTYSSRFIVSFNGDVQQNPPGIFRFICQIDVTYYPFDRQTCFLKLGSWTYNGKYINLDFLLKPIIGIQGNAILVKPERSSSSQASYFVNESIDLQVYLQNGEWDLEGTPGKRVVQMFGTDEYHELYFYIHIRRRTLAYGINLIIPSLVISMMTILGFTLPPDACEKITLETTVLLSVIFFLQMVSSTSPPQSQSVPILAAFFSCCLMLVACSCVFTVLTLSLHHRKPETHEMSPTMRKIFIDWLPYILCMCKPDHPKTPKPKVIDKSILPVHRLSTFIPMLNLPRLSQTSFPGKSVSVYQDTPAIIKNTSRICSELLIIERDIEKMVNKIEEDSKEEMLRSEWRFAAMAVDRLCLYVFSAFITTITCGLIVPHIIANI